MSKQQHITYGRTDGQTDGRYQTYYLPCFAVDNNTGASEHLYYQAKQAEADSNFALLSIARWDENSLYCARPIPCMRFIVRFKWQSFPCFKFLAWSYICGIGRWFSQETPLPWHMTIHTSRLTLATTLTPFSIGQSNAMTDCTKFAPTL